MKKRVFLDALLTLMFALSFIINATGDGRVYFKAWGIVFVLILLLFIPDKKKMFNNTSLIVKIAIGASVFMTLLAFLVPKINGGQNSILPNHFLAHVVILFVAYSVWSFDRGSFEVGIKIAGCVIFLSAIFGLFIWGMSYQTFDFNVFGYSIYGPPRRLNAVYVNPIPAGSVFLTGFWISTIYKTRWLAIIQRIFYCVVILLTQSRSTWIGLIVSLFILVVINRKQYLKQFSELDKAKKIVGIIGACIFALVVSLFVMKYMSHRIIGMFSGEAYNVRMSYWRYIWNVFKQEDLFWELFGHGYGSSSAMMLNSPVYYAPYAIIDNGLLTVLYENGVVCLFALFMVFYKAWLTIRQVDKLGTIEWVCGMVIISLIIPSCFYDIQGWLSPILLVLWCMAPFISKNQEQ